MRMHVILDPSQYEYQDIRKRYGHSPLRLLAKSDPRQKRFDLKWLPLLLTPYEVPRLRAVWDLTVSRILLMFRPSILYPYNCLPKYHVSSKLLTGPSAALNDIGAMKVVCLERLLQAFLSVVLLILKTGKSSKAKAFRSYRSARHSVEIYFLRNTPTLLYILLHTVYLGAILDQKHNNNTQFLSRPWCNLH